MTRDDDMRRDDNPPAGVAVNETDETIAEPPLEVIDVDVEQDEGRFSEGQEQLPETPEKDVERRFSEGQERHPFSE
jgi:hypothetical protein